MASRFQDYDHSAAFAEKCLQALGERLRAAGVKHALVAGSAARGEMTFVCKNDRLLSLSDIELIVVDHCGLDKDLCRREIERLVHELDLGANFSIDYDFLSAIRLRTLRNRLFTFEAFHRGRELVGSPKIYFPNFKVSRLDMVDLNLSLLWRVFALEKAFISTNSSIESEYDKRFYNQYFLARNILDLFTVYLYFTGGSETTYSSRLEAAIELADSDAFLRSFLQIYRRAMLWKITPARAFSEVEITHSEFREVLHAVLERLHLAGFKFSRGLPSKVSTLLWEAYFYRLNVKTLYGTDCFYRLCNDPSDLVYRFLREYCESGSISRDFQSQLVRHFPYLNR